ncbi:isopenicillin N synthase family oxygenase [Patescibacteria group bacterium]|nr:isopenicillin N synthase family oxygenase [Patescibacteria group bacterium]
MNNTLIKTLDWELVITGRIDEFIQEVREALSTTGFFLLKNHGIPADLLQENREQSLDFFKLPLEERMKYAFPELHGQVGYTPMNVEVGEFATIADNKHFYHFSDLHENPVVTEVLGYTWTMETLFDFYNQLYRRLMQIVALSLDLSEHHFDNELGNSLLRNIHYPANPTPVDDDEAVTFGGNALGMCASKHTDINHLTLLHATEPGLELWFQNQWQPVQCDPDTLVVNTGDMLWHLTAGLYKSGVHRVVCQPNVERFSCPFFGHRKPETSVVPLAHLGFYDKSVFRFKTVGEYLDHRLEKINLKT